MDTLWFLLLCFYSIPFLVIPLIVGLVLISKPSRLHKFTGWYTFKPVIATPIACAIMSSLTLKLFNQINFMPIGLLLIILPGVALTLLITLLFRDLFTVGSRKVFILFFVLDILRMASMLGGLALYIQEGMASSGVLPADSFVISYSIYMIILSIALVMPTFFAVVALITYWRTKQPAAKNALV